MECLVQKLFGVVDNDSLPVFGKIIFDVHKSGQTGYIRCEPATGSSPVVLTIEGNGYFVDGGGESLGKTLTISSAQTVNISDGDYKIITEHYNNISVLMERFFADVVKIEALEFTLDFTMTTLTMFATNNPTAAYDIDIFAAGINLTDIITSGSQALGEIESLADKMHDSGRTTGRLGIVCNGIITLNGVAVSNGTKKYINFTSEGYTISDQ